MGRAASSASSSQAFTGPLARELDEIQYRDGPYHRPAALHPEQAFELLTRLSQSTHRKLRDCAADLVAGTIKNNS